MRGSCCSDYFWNQKRLSGHITILARKPRELLASHTSFVTHRDIIQLDHPLNSSDLALFWLFLEVQFIFKGEIVILEVLFHVLEPRASRKEGKIQTRRDLLTGAHRAVRV